MAEIIKTYLQSLPALRLIGKKYGEEDRRNGSFGFQWGEWFSKGWFEPIEKRISPVFHQVYEDADAYVGFMCIKDGAPFQYWIGMLTPSDTEVPDGYISLDLPATEAAVAWVYGKEETGDVYCQEKKSIQALNADGIPVHPCADGTWRCFERYVCPRFTTPDEKGNIILDLVFLPNL